MIKVSVVIPVYNVEKYLSECLDSVLGQTLREIECICIDDASPDRCGEMLDEYAARDGRVRVLHLKENHMQGYGRNRGLEMAKGEYVYFLDSDDMITPNAMEELYLLAKRDELDGIFFDSQVILESEDLARFASAYLCFRKGEYPDEVLDGPTLMDLFYRNGDWMVYVQRQFWRRDYLLENRIFFPEKTEHEDELFSFEATLLAKRVRYVRRDYFIHRYRKNSVMTRNPHPKDFVGYFRIFNKMIEFASAHQLGGPTVEWIIAHMFECTLRFLDDFENNADPADWLSREEQASYTLMREILHAQQLLRSRDRALWAPLNEFVNVWIYGAGRVARRVYARLYDCDFRVAGFIVTSMKGNPERLFDLPVISAETLESIPEGDVVVVAMASTMHAGPAEILRRKGIPYFLYFDNKLNYPSNTDTETV